MNRSGNANGLPARLAAPAWGKLGMVLTVLVLTFGLAGQAALAKPQFAAIAVDARNGKVLFAREPDGLRHPASLTKVMTLYLLFQDLKAKRLGLQSTFRVSARAAGMAPSKLGVRPGQTITIDQAIRALVTKSANDVASVIAENLGGSEGAFATRMTRTARAIGMKRSTFRNASGLPDPGQWTTARDMATLSLRIQRDFPEYYPYFRIMAFTYNGRVIRTHNRLLGKYAGTDGIKTGYIRASGFNLTSSVKRGDRRVVGVVLGAVSGGSRNTYMMRMLDKALPQCSRGSTIAASTGGPVASETVEAASLAEPVYDSPAPAKPKKRNFGGKMEAEPVVARAEIDDAVEPVETGDADDATEFSTAAAPPTPDAAEPTAIPSVVLGSLGPTVATDGKLIAPANDSLLWKIQVGAYPTEAAADSRIAMARQSAGRELQGKQDFVSDFVKEGSQIYRARFFGFSKKEAVSACRALAQKGIECMALDPRS